MLETKALTNFDEKFETKREAPLLQSKIATIINIYKTTKQRKGEEITANRLEDIRYILDLCINIEDEDLLHDQVKNYLENNLYHNICFLFIRSWTSYFKDSLITTLNWHTEKKELNRAKARITELEKAIKTNNRLAKNALKHQQQENEKVVLNLTKKIESLNEMITKLSQEIEILQRASSLEQIEKLHKIISDLQMQNMAQSNLNQPELMFDATTDSSQEKAVEKIDSKDTEKQQEGYVFLELQPM